MLNTSTVEIQRAMRLREGEDRRTQSDRRRSSVDMRLRVGLWYQYHRATRAGEFDPFPRSEYKRVILLEALMPEMLKYEFFNMETGGAVTAAEALTQATDFLWSCPKVGCNAAGESMAVYAVNAVAEFVCRTFKVETIDRRKDDRRTRKTSNAIA